jgi:hypothetical protein
MQQRMLELFDWANKIGDANINNRILAKVMPLLMQERIVLTDSMIKERRIPNVSEEIYNAIQESAESLLETKYEGGR